MKKTNNPFVRLAAYGYCKLMDISISEIFKIKMFYKTVKYINRIPGIHDPEKFILERLEFHPKNENELEMDSYNQPLSLLKALVMLWFIEIINIVFTITIYNTSYENVLFALIVFHIILLIPLLIWTPLYFVLPKVYSKRFHAFESLREWVKESAIKLTNLVIPRSDEIQIEKKAQFLHSGYLFMSMLNSIGEIKCINLHRQNANLARLISIYFLNTQASPISAAPYRKQFIPLKKIDLSNLNSKHDLIMEMISKVPKEIYETIKFNGKLNGKVQLSIDPTIFKQLLVILNGKLFEKMEEPFLDSFISNTFCPNKSKITKNIPDLDVFLNRLKAQLLAEKP